MQFSTVFAALVMAVSARPPPTFMRLKATADYSWDVSEWTASCPNTTCKYGMFAFFLFSFVPPADQIYAADFKVHGTENMNGNPKRPGFTAHCAGDTEGSPYRLCTLDEQSEKMRRVAAKLLPWTTKSANSTSARIQVSFQYTDLDSDSAWWNFTGHATSRYTHTPLDFKIKPDEIFGVA
ncbi:hypothetical protein PG997_004899 [Apiospora hydei]|uniref:Uncharacterized protein n=1 Tax=Apiospora hydei TaxID=1337664 RepID=A0ABR1X3E6_9PEZI